MTGPRCYANHNAPDCIEAGVEPDDMCSNCLDAWEVMHPTEAIEDEPEPVKLAGVRPPLAKGDDGSANRYPSRAG